MIKQHWDTIYQTKNANEMSWTQETPTISLNFVHSLNLPKNAKIIDIGGGDSKLVDFLLEEGFENISVLDISAQALDRAKKRLGDKAKKITWILSDVTLFRPSMTYDLWHDRAAFHFLITKEQIEKYVEIARNTVSGYLIIGTFSTKGPTKCSGLDIKQYSEESLAAELENNFIKLKCITADHITPFNTVQNFLFCSFKKC